MSKKIDREKVKGNAKGLIGEFKEFITSNKGRCGLIWKYSGI